MADAQERSAVEKALGIIAEVKAGEGGSALLLTLNVFLLLSAYYLIKPVREALILAQEGGANVKSYLGAAIAVALLFAVPLYARFAKRLPRNKLIVGATLFFVSHIVLFYIASNIPTLRGYLGIAFFIWVGIFSMMVVAQFWAFANDIYTEEQGKRLFAILGVGASVGSWFGSAIASQLTEIVGVYNLLLLAAAILAVCAFLSEVVHRREIKRPREPGSAEKKGPEPERSGAFQMVFKHRYLTLIAGFALVFTFVNTNGEFMLGSLVKAESEAKATSEVTAGDVSKFLANAGADEELGAWFAKKGERKFPGKKLAEVRAEVARAVVIEEHTKNHIGATYGDFFSWVNAIGVIFQLFVVSRLVKYLGLGRAFLLFPAISLVSCGATALFPMLAVLRIGKTAENSIDYSLNNTLRNMLWLPTTKDMKYQAKQAIDAFFVRMGDVSSAVLVYVGSELLSWTVRGFAISNLVLIAVWIVLARAIATENRRLTQSS